MSDFNVNITPEVILAQKANEQNAKRKSVFDAKNYLNTRLDPSEVTKTLVIRLLPFSPDGGSPFFKVHVHQVKVNKEVSASGWKTFPCPVKNNLGDKCPFCETSAEAMRLKNNATSEQEKKKYSDIAFANRAREFWIVRCIERGHEEDGVKFWLFSSSKKGEGVYDKIMNIFQQRYVRAAEQGKVNNIFDLNEGKDLFITLTRDTNGKTVINVADDDEKSPLSTDYEKAMSWINDDKKWDEVYTVKPYDYMSIIVGGGVPKKKDGKYYDKEELEAAEQADIEKNLTQTNMEYFTEEKKEIVPQEISLQEAIADNDFDLPF